MSEYLHEVAERTGYILRNLDALTSIARVNYEFSAAALNSTTRREYWVSGRHNNSVTGSVSA